MTTCIRYFGFITLFFCAAFCSTASAQSKSNWEFPHFSEDAASLYKAASVPTAKDGSDVLLLSTEESYVYGADGKVVHTAYLLYKVLTQRGADGWGGVAASYEPWHEEKPSVRARVILADSSVHLLDAKTLVDQQDQDDDDNVYGDRRTVRAPLPAISSGSLVEEEEITKESGVFFAAGTVTRFYFGGTVPNWHTKVVVDTPASTSVHYTLKLLPEVKPERVEENGRVRLIFEKGSMEAREPVDNNMPSNQAAYPYVAFTTGDSWQHVAEAYEKIVDKQIGTLDLKGTVAKLIKDKTSRQEKIAAIVQYLHHEVRYTGVEFGEASIVPHSPAETLKHKYGDCKDKSTLLVAMLRTAELPAYVALLNAGAREDVPADLPGMGLFDHAVVYVPGEPAYWIDATDPYTRVGQMTRGDEGRWSLIARNDSGTLVKTPVSASKDNVLLEKREFILAEYGPARVIETSEPKGSFEAEYRSYYEDLNKKSKENLKEYVKNQYLAESLERTERSEPADLTKQFLLVLESSKAKRGYTDLGSAVAAIRLEGLFTKLPDELQQREVEDKPNLPEEEKSKKKRTSDFQLTEAFVAEWQYTINAPPGFRAKPLPKNEKITAGPGLLTEEFSLDDQGAIHADIRFDTGKRDLTLAEMTEMRNKVADLKASQPIVLYFEPTAQVLLSKGKAREAFQDYRNLIAQYPKSAVHHLQLAQALLTAGLGQSARDEARAAVKLEPKSALAEKTLADILEYDLVGRKFRRGSDYAGAEAAFRAAKNLDSEDKTIPGNLAILLEYNNDGERYGAGSRLKEATAEYRGMKDEDLASLGLKTNLAYTLMYSGEFAEARKYAESLNPKQMGVIVASTAALDGLAPGMDEAHKRSGDEASLKQIQRSAGEILMRSRKYALAAEFMEAGAGGEKASNALGLAAVLRRATLHEDKKVENTPEGVAREFFSSWVSAKLTWDKLKALSSRNAIKTMDRADQDRRNEFLKAGRQIRATLMRTGYPVDVMVDVTLALIQTRSEGDDDSGYRVTVKAAGAKEIVLYVLKEEGRYKILDNSDKPNALALEALDRLNAQNVKGARALLDWAREAQHLGGGDDPLEGLAFPRFWTKGKEADAAAMKVAAAVLLVEVKETVVDGLPILEAARGAAKNDAERLNITFALLGGYGEAQEYEKQVAVGNELLKEYPESKQLFLSMETALRRLGRFPDAESLAQNRLKQMQDDVDANRSMIYAATLREDYELAHQLSEKLVNGSKSETIDWNAVAWNSLFTGHVADSDLQAAVKATQLSQNAASELHTLGCVYAEKSKTKEAREVLIQAMDQLNLDEPDENYWYGFGRIAEQYGERDAAKANYLRVGKPKKNWGIPGSSYWLAQNRLKTLENTK